MSGTAAVLTGIKTHARGSRRRTLVLDGDPWETIPVEVLRDLDLREGDVIDLADLHERIASAAPIRARERALRLLMYRERSEHELFDRLTSDGYPPEIAHEVVTSLISSGLLDDDRFAENYARMLVLSRGYGRARALRELLKRGIDQERALEALEAVAPEDHEVARAGERAHALARAGDTRDRLAARLVRRGFSPGIALSAARTELESRGEPCGPEESF